MFVSLSVGLESDVISVYVDFIFSHYLTFLKETIQTKKKTKNNFIPNDSSFLKDSNEWDRIWCICCEALPPTLLLSPPDPHAYFICRYFRHLVIGGGWGSIPLGPNKDYLIIKYIERQVQDMKHSIGILKNRERQEKRFIIEASVKRLDWTLQAFKYSYNYHKY